jgi:hypothetical protein
VTWFKVDDKLHDHRKARAAGTRAMGVWILAASWSSNNVTDGYVPVSVASRWGDRRDFNRLVTAGLWTEDTSGKEPGYLFVNWSRYQRTRAQIDEDRLLAAERMRTLRKRRTD